MNFTLPAAVGGEVDTSPRNGCCCAVPCCGSQHRRVLCVTCLNVFIACPGMDARFWCGSSKCLSRCVPA